MKWPKVDPKYSTITIVEPDFPEWSQGRILIGNIRRPQSINFMDVMKFPYFHPRQINKKHVEEEYPSGHEILASLVRNYKVNRDKAGRTYKVMMRDGIHYHFGLAELKYMEKNWSTLPEDFKIWAKGKFLYAWRDVLRNKGGNLRVSHLDCHTDQCKPSVEWISLNLITLDDCDPGLCGSEG